MPPTCWPTALSRDHTHSARSPSPGVELLWQCRMLHRGRHNSCSGIQQPFARTPLESGASACPHTLHHQGQCRTKSQRQRSGLLTPRTLSDSCPWWPRRSEAATKMSRPEGAALILERFPSSAPSPCNSRSRTCSHTRCTHHTPHLGACSQEEWPACRTREPSSSSNLQPQRSPCRFAQEPRAGLHLSSKAGTRRLDYLRSTLALPSGRCPRQDDLHHASERRRVLFYDASQLSQRWFSKA
mmetsp:Transcript_64416/g.119798  ORF Transcript_64416/g.119798 Transcript_64416/m.119798 type:complete len:241 (+) Transcript_64416:212-934(+)